MQKPCRINRADNSLKQQVTILVDKAALISNQEQFEKALSFITQSKELLKSVKNIDIRTQLESLILNTEAFIYHRQSLQKQALSTIDLAVSLEKANTQSLARTYLNKCSILDTCKRHGQALHLAKKVNQLLNGKKLKEPNRFQRENNRQIYIASFLTIGAQYQKMQMFEQALQTYEKGVQASRIWIGEKNKLSQILLSKLNTLKRRTVGSRLKTKPSQRKSQRGSIRTLTQTNQSPSKQKQFRIKEVNNPKSSTQDKTRSRNPSVLKNNRDYELMNVYYPKLKSLEFKTKRRILTETDEMKDIQKIKVIYRPYKDSKAFVQKPQYTLQKDINNNKSLKFVSSLLTAQ